MLRFALRARVAPWTRLRRSVERIEHRRKSVAYTTSEERERSTVLKGPPSPQRIALGVGVAGPRVAFCQRPTRSATVVAFPPFLLGDACRAEFPAARSCRLELTRGRGRTPRSRNRTTRRRIWGISSPRRSPVARRGVCFSLRPPDVLARTWAGIGREPSPRRRRRPSTDQSRRRPHPTANPFRR